MLRPNFLPGYLQKVLSEMTFEGCKILEYPDYQVVGINPALKTTDVWVKNNCVSFLGS